MSSLPFSLNLYQNSYRSLIDVDVGVNGIVNKRWSRVVWEPVLELELGLGLDDSSHAHRMDLGYLVIVVSLDGMRSYW